MSTKHQGYIGKYFTWVLPDMDQAKPRVHARKTEGHIYPEILRKTPNHGLKVSCMILGLWESIRVLLYGSYEQFTISWIHIFISKWIVEDNLAQVFICILTVALYPNKLFSCKNDAFFSENTDTSPTGLVIWPDPLPYQPSANLNLPY